MSESQGRFVRNAITAHPDLARSCKSIVRKLLPVSEDTDTGIHLSVEAKVASIAEDVEGFAPNLEVYISELVSILKNGPSLEAEDDCQGTICLGAMLEWLGSLGDSAGRALSELETVLKDSSPNNRRAFDQALDAMQPTLNQSPLGIVREFIRNTQCDVPGTPIIPNMRAEEISEGVGDDSMAVATETKYTLAEAADYTGSTESEVSKWLASGVLGVDATKDSMTGECVFSGSDLRVLRNHNVSVLVASIFDAPNDWLDSPNPCLGGFPPRDLLGTERDVLVLELLEGICHGIPT
jgi:hypothetical protein